MDVAVPPRLPVVDPVLPAPRLPLSDLLVDDVGCDLSAYRGHHNGQGQTQDEYEYHFGCSLLMDMDVLLESARRAPNNTPISMMKAPAPAARMYSTTS